MHHFMVVISKVFKIHGTLAGTEARMLSGERFMGKRTVRKPTHSVREHLTHDISDLFGFGTA
jgi:hypothetical protein